MLAIVIVGPPGYLVWCWSRPALDDVPADTVPAPAGPPAVLRLTGPMGSFPEDKLLRR